MLLLIIILYFCISELLQLGSDSQSEEKRQELRNKGLLDKKMITLFYEVIWDVFFLMLILLIVNGNLNSNMIYQNKNLETAILADIDEVCGKLWMIKPQIKVL